MPGDTYTGSLDQRRRSPAPTDYHALCVRLLLDRSSEEDWRVWPLVDWARVLQIARKNVIVIRTLSALKAAGVSVGSRELEEASRSEQYRIGKVSEAIGRINELGERHGVPLVFLKSFQHYPDMGDDIDILIQEESHRFDALLLEHLPARRLMRNAVHNAVSGRSDLALDAYGTSIEIHHRRLGQMGEHSWYSENLIRRSSCSDVAGMGVRVPSDEDQLLMHVIQRMYSQFYVRISDLVASIRLVQRADLDWEYASSTARRAGILEGLRAYLFLVNSAASSLTGDAGLSRQPVELSEGSIRLQLTAQGSYYRYPVIPDAVKLYFRKLSSDLTSGEFAGAARMAMFPVFGVLHVASSLFRGRSRFFD